MAPLTILLAGGVGMACIHYVCEFYSEYSRTAALVESERPLFLNCKNASFFHMLGQHTDLCVRVEGNHRIGPFMLALRKVAERANLAGVALSVLEAMEASGWRVFLFCAGPLVLIGALACLLVGPSSFLRQQAPVHWDQPSGGVRYIAIAPPHPHNA